MIWKILNKPSSQSSMELENNSMLKSMFFSGFKWHSARCGLSSIHQHFPHFLGGGGGFFEYFQKEHRRENSCEPSDVKKTPKMQHYIADIDVTKLSLERHGARLDLMTTLMNMEEEFLRNEEHIQLSPWHVQLNPVKSSNHLRVKNQRFKVTQSATQRCIMAAVLHWWSAIQVLHRTS